MLATPLIALTVSPVKAAAIMLPVLIMMDMVGLYNYRHSCNWSVIRHMLPAALVGIGIGWLTAHWVSEDWVRIMVGLVAISFAVIQFRRDLLKHAPAKHSLVGGAFWGTLAGFTSFISHAGGPPFQAYALPLKMDKIIFAGTSVIFFTMVNAAKVLPYFMLGQFTSDNLHISLALVPVAVIGVLIGVWAVKKVSQKFFYNVTYVTMLVIGTKLLWDGREAIQNLL